jgi:hypothetical protein
MKFQKSFFYLRAFLSVLICVHLGTNSLPVFSQSQTKFRPSEKAYKWADKRLKKMSLDERIGQLVHVGINARFQNQDSPEFKELKRHVVENKVGGIIVFVGGVYETVHLMNRMQQLAETPLLISSILKRAWRCGLRTRRISPGIWRLPRRAIRNTPGGWA